MALNSKKKAFDRGEIQFDTIWDKLVFKKIQGIMGGELRLLVSGAAPLSADKMLFFRSAMGCWVSMSHVTQNSNKAVHTTKFYLTKTYVTCLNMVMMISHHDHI
ncbi:long-chain-fatty-acid--CoA ligase 5-like [Anneissia japonica]|uniref:long-chain-fatty-acid--CoA ligase 5-like n=1 Tax=Anneissia japonica TaxID=1529436 RepID=UPI00142582BC|nr:long-chain-fatty-acid--CoA ligase 5-like [Anneissia japonica]